MIEDWLAARHAPLSAIIESEGFARNAAILAAVEAVNENDESRKRFEVMCASVVSKFKACINFAGINEYRGRYDAIIALLKFVEQLDEEETRAVSEGLDEESLAIFDLIRKPKLKPQEIARVKDVARELLAKLKAEKLKIDHWQEKERARDGVKQDIFDFFFADDTGLPAAYSEPEIKELTTLVYQHVFAVYPKVPSPYFQGMAEAC